METIWECSIESEAKRLIHCAHQIAVGFYRVNNFIVLPYTPKYKNTLVVTFPDLPYSQIHRFWDQAKKVSVYDFPISTSPLLVQQVAGLLINENIRKPEYKNIINCWKNAEKEILNEAYRIMPGKKEVIKKITIYPTSFGTSTSFSYKPTNTGEIYIYLREDKGVYEIVEAIITSLTRDEIYKDLGGMWQESEIITDWILTKSSLAKVLSEHLSSQNYVPTVKGTRNKQQAKLLKESDNFYKKLGLPIGEQVFNINGKTPEIYKKPITNLTESEKIMLRLLIEKTGNVVTFDEIGDNLFSDENSFSLYAISKSVERLRKKLEANGVSGSYIQTLRGKGYLLKN